MSSLTPDQQDSLQQHKRAALKAKAQGRRWYLRAVLMMIIAVVAGTRGGQVNRMVGIVMVGLAGVSVSLGRSIRRGAAATLERIDLMEKGTAPYRESGQRVMRSGQHEVPQ